MPAPPQRVLVTGGAGFLGSHTAVALLAAGRDVVLLDNLDNGRADVARQVAAIAGRAVPLVVADVRDRTAVVATLRDHRIDAVIHFAGRKAVAESVHDPLPYFDHNVAGSISLLLAMREAEVRSLVFSSSAAVYAPGAATPAREDGALAPASPYGVTKRMVEEVLATTAAADPAWRIVALRYFNPVGAHPSGLLGEQPAAMPSNLMPIVLEAATGRRAEVRVHGGDYGTPDGTAIRDYIHVMDLAEAHLAALDWWGTTKLGAEAVPAAAIDVAAGVAQATGGFLVANIGTGRGTSVLELLAAFEAATGVAVPYRIGERRPGDLPACWADPALAARELGWRARRDIAQVCHDAWRWERTRLGLGGTSPAGSGGSGSTPQGSTPQGSAPQGWDPQGSDPQGSAGGPRS